MGTVPEAYYEFVMHYAPYFYVIPTLLSQDAAEGQKFVNVVDGSKFQTKFPVEIKDEDRSISCTGQFKTPERMKV